MFLGKTKQETKSVLNTDSRREQGGGRDWAPCLSSSFSSPTELCSTGCSPCSFCLMELGLARQPAAAAAARLNEKNKGRAVTQLRPFQLRPFQQRPFQLRPFQLRPFQLRPFQLRPFQLRPFQLRPFQLRPFSCDLFSCGLFSCGLFSCSLFSPLPLPPT